MSEDRELPPLLPCPFCGCAVTMERTTGSYEDLYGRRKWWGIICRSTFNRGGTCAVQISPQASPEAAADRWNMRNGHATALMQRASADRLTSRKPVVS